MRAAVLLASIVLLVTLVAARHRPPIFPPPLPGLTTAEEAAYVAGRQEFLKQYTTSQGLGPEYSGAFCGDCHRSPDFGGDGPRYLANIVFGRNVGGVFDPLTSQGGPVFDLISLADPKSQVPAEANVVTFRKVPRLFGLGLVEAVPDATLLAIAGQNGGRALTDASGRVQRYGAQNRAATLYEFIDEALREEMGVTPEERAPGTESRINDFLLMLAPLPRGPIGDNEIAGAQVFANIGCADCHIPSLQTHAGPFTVGGVTVDIGALQGVTFAPYSDFLLHDLGEHLDDGLTRSEAETWEHRTTPLWGYRYNIATQLHDGRSAALNLTIHLHGGEAHTSRAAYRNLSNQERFELHRFLESL